MFKFINWNYKDNACLCEVNYNQKLNKNTPRTPKKIHPNASDQIFNT